MKLVVVLVVLALVLGGFGLAVETLRWLLIVALIVMAIGAFVGWSRRSVA